MSTTRQFAVFGNPIAQSRSPMIHQLFAEQFSIDMQYTAQLVPTTEFRDAAAQFFSAGGAGLNITLPFKEEAFASADYCTERARIAHAVNTMSKDPATGQIIGDNTDGIGMLTDIEKNLGWVVADQRVLVIGAGGAARGVIQPLLDAGLSELVVANRTREKAVALINDFDDPRLRGEGFESLSGESFQLVINATSASLSGEVPRFPASFSVKDACTYDMVYASAPTAFMLWSQQSGAKAVADGLGMLVEQAAEAFYLWHGQRPQTRVVISAVREQLMSS